MKKYLIILLCIIPAISFSQRLTNSSEKSYYNYIYKISEKETKEIIKKGFRFRNEKILEKKYLHTKVDSFLINSYYEKELEQGAYLKVRVEQNFLYYELITVSGILVNVVDNGTDLCLQISDKEGNIISDAKLSIRAKKIKFDKASQTYKISKSNKKGLLRVEYNGNKSFYKLERDRYNPLALRTYRKIIYSKPLIYTWLPVYNTIRHPRNTFWKYNRIRENWYEWYQCKFNDDCYYYCKNYSRKYIGYMVFNKPKYKPLDTVKFKAFVINKKGKPINKKVSVILEGIYYPSKKIKIAEIEPYRNGGYSYEFVLHDSLDILLDKNYKIYLETSPRKCLISKSFMFEEYELVKSKFTMRTSQKNHYKGKPFSIYLKATDENEMNLLDANVEIVVFSKSNGRENPFLDYTFIPDTVWKHNQKLDAIGETKIIIPDSIMPTASFGYEISATMKTSDNEAVNKERSVYYKHFSQKFNYKYINDSINFYFKKNDIEKQKTGLLSAFDKNDELIYKENIKLPIKKEINQAICYYTFSSDNFTANTKIDFLNYSLHGITEHSSKLRCNPGRTKDSVFIYIHNPRKLKFNYFIYAANKELQRGFADSLFYSNKASQKKMYSISIEYLWEGEMVEENYDIPFYHNMLSVSVKQPTVIYPGKTSEIELTVTDAKGEPVQNVDITAFGLTQKFDYTAPTIPAFQERTKQKKWINNFSIKTKQNNKYNNIHLKKQNYKQASKIFRLDTMEFYKFIYPENSIYYSYENTSDSLTQFAPFIHNFEKTETINIIYVDKAPVYFIWSENNFYSFRIDSGYHNIELRTYDKLYKLDSIYFPHHKKTVFSFNSDIEYENITVYKKSPKFTQAEKDNLYRYFLFYRSPSNLEYAYIKNKENIFLLNNNKYRDSHIIAPVFYGYIELNTLDSNNHFLHYERYFEYEFFNKLIKMRSKNTETDYPKKYHQNYRYLFWQHKKNLYSYKSEVYTKAKLEEDRKQYIYSLRRSGNNLDEDRNRYNYKYNESDNDFYNYYTSNTKLTAEFEQNKDSLPILNILISNNKGTKIFGGDKTNFDYLNTGFYTLTLFFPDAQYQVYDSLQIRPYGINYQKIKIKDDYKKDTFSILAENYFNKNAIGGVYLLNVKMSKLFDDYVFSDTIVATIYDRKTNLPIENVWITPVDNSYLVFSDSLGRFEIIVKKGIGFNFSKQGYFNEKITSNQEKYYLEPVKEELIKIKGRVVDENGEGISDFFIQSKEIRNTATITDFDGNYSIQVKESDSLIFRSMGMETQAVAVRGKTIIDVVLFQDDLEIGVVVVTGLEIKRSEKMIGYSVTTNKNRNPLNALQGKVAGVNITAASGAPGASTRVIMRGFTEFSDDNQPLYIIDGVPVDNTSINGGTDFGNGSNDINPDDISEITTLDGATATALYGSRAENGVIIISTKKGGGANKNLAYPKGSILNDNSFFNSAFQHSAIRNNFSDYAFWQPTLNTDENGKAKFEVTFPDDITNWSTYYLAMNGKKQSGQTQGSIKSFKPLMSQLAVPNFLIMSDSVQSIGKTMNYTSDTIELQTNFEINDSLIWQKQATCINSIIDSLQFVAKKDTVKVKYFLEKEDGYFDGEEREIPVFPIGIELSKGEFFVLDKDTSFSIDTKKYNGEVKLSVLSNELDVFMSETARIINYKYYCNEQLASKLKALLFEETIQKYKGEKFKKKSQVKKIIKRLENNQNNDRLWGWWANGNSNYWISLHVYEALYMARDKNYNVLSSQYPSNFLWRFSSVNIQNQIKILKMLKLSDSQIIINKYIKEVDENIKKQKHDHYKFNLLNQFELIELKQQANMKYSVDSILKYQQETMYGNIYFKDTLNKRHIYNSNILLTLSAYRILKATDYDEQILQKIRNYFFEQRSSGYWQNTYESSLIIENILPEYLKKEKMIEESEIIFTGSINKTITEFPYQTTVSDFAELNISKKGTFPIYLSVFQQYWEKEPKQSSEYFEIKTSFFDKKGKNLTEKSLIAGEKVRLIIDLKVKKKAEYVMLEIPIPAGCSYNGKKSSYANNEVHRQYFKTHTSIFCEELEMGKYEFVIELMPRFSGTYTLNPAKTELMYFPIFYGNNKVQKIEIK